MKIFFELAWVRPNSSRKTFKSRAAQALFEEYLGRIGRFVPCAARASMAASAASGQLDLWVCHESLKSKRLSSGQLARELAAVQQRGLKELRIAIGGSDGFTSSDIIALRPALIWSFGPLTLPHELAAVVASEQIYRAFTIINHQPYHESHG